MNIDFRAWDKTFEKLVYRTELLKRNMSHILLDPESCGLVLQLFTGLTDSKGTKIYEGDIVKVETAYGDEPYLSVVKWHGEKGYPAFDIEFPDEYLYGGNTLSVISESGKDEWMTVIGNVYQTPDLLAKCV